MARKLLRARNLSELSDGYGGKVIDAAIVTVENDMVERGDDGKPRKVTITLTWTPEGNGNTDIGIECKPPLPPLKPPKTSAKYDYAAGGTMFNPDCRNNPDQLTFADIAQPTPPSNED